MHYLFLEKDAVALREKLDRLEEQKLSTAQDAAIHVGQSSESWHDNAGFEIAIREQMRLSKETSEIRNMLLKMHTIYPNPKPNKVEVGSKILLKDLNTNEERTFIISSYQVLDKRSEEEISYTAPIIQPFINKRRGTQKNILTQNGEKKYEIISILPIDMEQFGYPN